MLFDTFLLNPTNGDIELIERQTGDDIIVHYASFSFESGGVKHYATIGEDKIYINREAANINLRSEFVDADAADEVLVFSSIKVHNDGSEAITVPSDFSVTISGLTFDETDLSSTTIPAGGFVTISNAPVPTHLRAGTHDVAIKTMANGAEVDSQMKEFVIPEREADIGDIVAIANNTELADYWQNIAITNNFGTNNITMGYSFFPENGDPEEPQGPYNPVNPPSVLEFGGRAGYLKVIPSGPKWDGSNTTPTETVRAVPEGAAAINGAALSVDDHSQEIAVAVYPNPVVDVVNFKNVPSGTQVDVYNLNGQKVATTTQSSVNVSHLAKGVYIVLLQNPNGDKASAKFIKLLKN